MVCGVIVYRSQNSGGPAAAKPDLSIGEKAGEKLAQVIEKARFLETKGQAGKASDILYEAGLLREAMDVCKRAGMFLKETLIGNDLKAKGYSLKPQTSG